MDTRSFEKIASSLTVNLICTPLLSNVADADSTVAEFHDPFSGKWPDKSGLDPYQHPMRVIDGDGKLVGMLWADNTLDIHGDERDVTVEEVMDRIEPSQFVSSDTSILDLVTLFANKDIDTYYVLHRNEVIGAVLYQDLFNNPIGRLAFFTLALEIEDQALQLCQSQSVRENCWKAIPEGRRQKAIELFEKRYGRSPRSGRDRRDHLPDTVRLIACTNLVDKATMIWKEKLIVPATRSDLLGFFQKLHAMRNKCAHPGEHGPLLPRNELEPISKLPAAVDPL